MKVSLSCTTTLGLMNNRHVCHSSFVTKINNMKKKINDTFDMKNLGPARIIFDMIIER